MQVLIALVREAPYERSEETILEVPPCQKATRWRRQVSTNFIFTATLPESKICSVVIGSG